jgi:nucleotide-binding universal stress UspA family protein
MSDAHGHDAGKYYVPHESKWPIIGSAAFFTFLLGVIALLNHWTSAWAMLPGFAVAPTDLDTITRTALEKHLVERADDMELLYGVLVEHQVLDSLDPVADQLVAYAAAQRIDLIVMVTHGRSATGRRETRLITPPSAAAP